MEEQEHRERILKVLQEKKEFVDLDPEKVEQIINKVNCYLDAYASYGDEPDTRIAHREIRHHTDGIEELTERFSLIYGKRYSYLIRSIAEKHILDDMGYIPKKEEYSSPYFWSKWKAKNEWFFNDL